MDTFRYGALRTRIDSAAKAVKKFYKLEKDVSYPIDVVRDYVDLMVYKYGESVLEDNGSVLMMQGRPEYDDLRQGLETPRQKLLAQQSEKVDQQELFVESESKTNGFVKFNPVRLEAMVVHLAYRAKNVFPTRLNKLMFYADFSHFALVGRSVSGAEYTKLTHGPIFSGYRHMLKQLERKRQIRSNRFRSKGKWAQIIRAKKTYEPRKSILSPEEIRLLDWVVENYDSLDTREIILRSHREMAYWDTHWRQPIDYHLAEFLENKPPKELLDS